MELRSLVLKDFRSYEEKTFHFGPQVNIISGPNACGKTTVLEAVHLLITGRSFRTLQLKELIRHGASRFYIELSFVKHGIEQQLRMAYDGKVREIAHNHTPCRSLTNLLGILLGSVMIPDDIEMISGAPKARRRYLDIQLAQTDPLYVHHLTRYHKALRNRNILLKKRTEAAIEVWEHELAKSASYIVKQRMRAVAELQEKSDLLMTSLSKGSERLCLEYKSRHSPSAEEYLGAFKALRRKELQLGATLVGPHRDDLGIKIGEREAKSFGSQGQQRSLAAALRFAEWERLRLSSEEAPLMLIDDIGISLDDERKKRLFAHLDRLGQVFITTTESLNIPGAVHAAL